MSSFAINQNENYYVYNKEKHKEELFRGREYGETYELKIGLTSRVKCIFITIINAFTNLFSKSKITTMDYLKAGFNITWNGEINAIKSDKNLNSKMIRIDNSSIKERITQVRFNDVWLG